MDLEALGQSCFFLIEGYRDNVCLPCFVYDPRRVTPYRHPKPLSAIVVTSKMCSASSGVSVDSPVPRIGPSTQQINSMLLAQTEVWLGLPSCFLQVGQD